VAAYLQSLHLAVHLRFGAPFTLLVALPLPPVFCGQLCGLARVWPLSTGNYSPRVQIVATRNSSSSSFLFGPAQTFMERRVMQQRRKSPPYCFSGISR